MGFLSSLIRAHIKKDVLRGRENVYSLAKSAVFNNSVVFLSVPWKNKSKLLVMSD